MRFSVRVFRERLSTTVCSSFPFGFKGRVWDWIVLISDHCLSIFFIFLNVYTPNVIC